jgi:hypothetical protein
MGKTATNLVLLAALLLPVAAFLLLFSRLNLSVLLSAAISIALGWLLNVIWANAADPRNDENYRSVALRFGWACPAVLVLATWAVLRFVFNASV